MSLLKKSEVLETEIHQQTNTLFLNVKLRLIMKLKVYKILLLER